MKLLITVSRFPYPLEKGDKLRSYNHIKYLSKTFDIYLFCLSLQKVSEQQIEALKPFCKDIKVVRIGPLEMFFQLLKNFLFQPKIPLQVSLFNSEKNQKLFDKYLEKVLPNMLFCQLIRTAHLAEKYTIYPRIIDYMDALSLGMKRRYLQHSNPVAKWVFKREYQNLKYYEALVFDKFDGHIIISEQDKVNISHAHHQAIEVVANGVDLDYFINASFEKKHDLCFVGNMNYPPNIEAAKFLVKEIIPLVAKTNPNVRCLLAGANPHANVRNLASSHIEVAGWLPDIRNAYLSARIFIAPMQLGSGLQNKLLEAMALGIPCITSDVANNSLGAKPGNEVLIANTAQEFATEICNLLKNELLQIALSKAGREFVEKNYSWESNNAKLQEFLVKTQNKKAG